MKLAYVGEGKTKGWRLPRGRGRPRKVKSKDTGNEQPQKEPAPEVEFAPSYPSDVEDLEEDPNQPV